MAVGNYMENWNGWITMACTHCSGLQEGELHRYLEQCTLEILKVFSFLSTIHYLISPRKGCYKFSMILLIHDVYRWWSKVVVDLKINANGMPLIVCSKISLFMVQVCGAPYGCNTFWKLSAEIGSNNVLTVACYIKSENNNMKWSNIHRCFTLVCICVYIIW